MTIDEILDAMPEPAAEGDHVYLVIDPVSRTISVPESEKVFAVTGDEVADRKYFLCPRYVGDSLDLAGMFLTVYFRNANGEADGYLVTDLAVSGDYVTFSWLLSEKVAAYMGAVQFSVCADLPNTAEKKRPDWNTTMASGEVLEGLHPDLGDVEAETSDVVTQLREQIAASTAAVEAAGTAQVQAVYDAATAASADTTRQIVDQGAQTLATIPADYTTLAKKVERLGNGKADAYMVTTKEAAASHEIHAQDGVLQATVQGATTQEGKGDPSPDNVRQIVGLGMNKKIVFDGSADELWAKSTTETDGLYRYCIPIDGAHIADTSAPSAMTNWLPLLVKGGTSSCLRGFTIVGGATPSLFVYTNGSDRAAFIAQLAESPLTLWCTADDGDGVHYVGIQTQDAAGNYRGVATEVGTAPLFEGDKVELCARSGCDKKIVLDGTEEWADYSGIYFVVHGVTKAARPYAGYCSHWLYKYDYAGLDMFVGDKVLYCGTALRAVFGGDVEKWKAYLAEQYAAGTPVTIWYYSVEYAPENELQVCKVTRTVKRLILDGTEGWSRNTDVGVYKSFYAPKDVYGWMQQELATHACTHFPPKKWNDAVGAEGNSCWDASASWGFRIDAAHLDGFDETATQTEQAATFKAYLAEQYAAGTPVTVVYPLAKSEVYAFDPAALRSLHSLPETVQASGLLSVTYPQDTTYTIQQLMAAIQALGGTI